MYQVPSNKMLNAQIVCTRYEFIYSIEKVHVKRIQRKNRSQVSKQVNRQQHHQRRLSLSSMRSAVHDPSDRDSFLYLAYPTCI